eukprot:TRINITY_DN13228_c0_g1_i6.p1 TRINITY_DN13228_c0_g1~~TRINITY_DN13228_c0_g1_i6.p1  ORF type:complete len:118 (-),score=9.43 TRINITY_DN13228_c0_g1_i6:660-1013(-)
MCIRDSVDILMIGGKANEQQSQRMMKDRLRFKEYIRIHYFEYPGLCSMPQISLQMSEHHSTSINHIRTESVINGRFIPNNPPSFKSTNSLNMNTYVTQTNKQTTKDPQSRNVGRPTN